MKSRNKMIMWQNGDNQTFISLTKNQNSKLSNYQK